MSNTYTSNVYQVGANWYYDILQNGVVAIHQDRHPDLPGLGAMKTAAVANAHAAVIIARLATEDAKVLIANAQALQAALANITDPATLAQAQANAQANAQAAQTAQAAAVAARAAAVTAANAADAVPGAVVAS